MKEKQVGYNVEKLRKRKRISLPEIITCPKCGFDMEIWTDEQETRCMNCGHRFFSRESTVH